MMSTLSTALSKRTLARLRELDVLWLKMFGGFCIARRIPRVLRPRASNKCLARLRRPFDLVVFCLEHAFAVAFMAIGHVTATVVYRRSGLNRPKLRCTQRLSHFIRHRALHSYRNRCP